MLNLYMAVHQFPGSPEREISVCFAQNNGIKMTSVTLANRCVLHFSRISTPRTKYSPESINTVPLYGLQLMKRVIGGLFPELKDIGFTDSRVCPPLNLYQYDLIVRC